MRLIWRILAVGSCAVLAVDLVIGYGWYQQRQEIRRTGFTARTYVNPAGVEYGYVVFVPYDLPPNERPPLLMFLNGRGQNGDDGVQQISNNFGLPIWEMQREFPFVCLAPQCSEEGTWNADGPDAQAALAILDQAIAEYGLDPDRLYLTGVSSGGSGVFSIAAEYPDKFAAIVPLAGASSGHSIDKAADIYAHANLPIWNFYNGGDKEGLVMFNRNLNEELVERGLSPVFIEYDQSGHNCWDWAYRTPALYDWLLRQDRKQNVRRSRFRCLPIDESLSGWQAESETNWSVEDGVLRIQHSADDSFSRLMSTADVEDFELHFEYRSEEASTFEVVLQLASEGKDELWVVIAWPEDGTGGVLQSETGKWLSGTEPLAQQSLRRGLWNDIRVHRADDQLTVRVNGLLLIDVEKIDLGGPCRFGFAAGPDNGDGQWRYVRLSSGQREQP